ncbi:hypothetical protein Pfo_022264 [Paulownia fortunei]|nr:hypothetical protein Pfo_022264 [Paulownia fortunei]
MARMLVVLLVVSAFLSSAAEGTVIGYPALGRNWIWKPPPAAPANPYQRGCEPSEQCRGGGRRLLAMKSLPKVSSHGLQQDIGIRN